MEELNDLIDIAKEYTLLYVEDDERLQEETLKIFNRIFKSVITANNGAEGLALYSKEPSKFDLVITDIEMPVLNGLEMVKGLKAINAFVPVIVVSAYTDAEYFLHAIEYNVDYYAVKPINTRKLLHILLTACQHIADKANAERFREQTIRNQIENEKQELLEKMSNSSPNPILLYKHNTLQFVNEAFSKTFLKENCDNCIQTEDALIAFLVDNFCKEEFLIRSNEITQTLSLQILKDHTVQIGVKTQSGDKFFSLTTTLLENEGSNTMMYTFNDITQLLFQKIQLELYDKQIDNMVKDKFVTKVCVNNGIINKVSF